MESVLSLRNVSKNYGTVPALQDVSLSLPRGKIIGLLGANGLRYKLKNLSSTSLR